ncbi:MAG: DsbA family protein, partial [Solirubrobacteraceae bacterium]
VLVAAAAVIVALIAINSSGGSGTATVPKPTSAKAKQAVAAVDTLLKGIPQQGTTLGSPNAKVTVTEYGDLVCPICKDFALGSESQLISNDVRSGKVKIVYKALETASGTANNSMFVPSQVAARAAGEQKLGWYYIELFYHEQGDETTSYVTKPYLEGLAEQVPGLNYSQWSGSLSSSTLANQVKADEQAAASAGYNSTPTIIVSGPKAQAPAIVGDTTYSSLESAIKSVS